MAFGRVFRRFDAGWEPIGEPLPTFEHAPPNPMQPIAAWVLPIAVEARIGDVVVWQEVAHQLIGHCGPDSPEVHTLAAQTMALHGADETSAWLAVVDVWVGRRLKPEQDWPMPPETMPPDGVTRR